MERVVEGYHPVDTDSENEANNSPRDGSGDISSPPIDAMDFSALEQPIVADGLEALRALGVALLAANVSDYYCNSCWKGINGRRYQCLQCPDLDVCEACTLDNRIPPWHTHGPLIPTEPKEPQERPKPSYPSLKKQLKHLFEGDEEELQAVLQESGVDVNTYRDGFTPLLHRLRDPYLTAKDKKCIQMLLRHSNIDLTLRVCRSQALSNVCEGFSALDLCALYGHREFAEDLCGLQQDLVNQTTFGMRRQTPLHVAAVAGHVGVVAVLLAHGAEAALLDGEGATPLQLAERARHKDVVRVLGGVVVETHFPQPSLVDLIKNESRGVKLPPMILEVPSESIGELLYLSCAKNNVEALKALIIRATPACWDYCSGDGAAESIIHAAVDHLDVLKVLVDDNLARRANFNMRNARDLTPLALALERGKYASAALLLSCPRVEASAADIAFAENASKAAGVMIRGRPVLKSDLDKHLLGLYTAHSHIQEAVQAELASDLAKMDKEIGAVREWLETNPGVASINSRVRDETLLTGAVKQRAVNAVERILVLPGLNINFTESDGWAPIHHAANLGDEALLRLMVRISGINVNCVIRDGLTPAMLLAFLGHVKALTLFLDDCENAGKLVDISTPADTRTGNTVIHIACFRLLQVAGGTAVIRRLFGMVDSTKRSAFAPFLCAAEVWDGNAKLFFVLRERYSVAWNWIHPVFGSFLQIATHRGHDELCKQLLDQNEVNAGLSVTHGVRCALGEAVVYARVESFERLLNDVHVNLRVMDGTMLHVAISFLVQDLIKDSQELTEGSPRSKVLRLLLNHPRVDVNAIDGKGNSALASCFEGLRGKPKLLMLLLEEILPRGADLTQKRHNRKTGEEETLFELAFKEIVDPEMRKRMQASLPPSTAQLYLGPMEAHYAILNGDIAWLRECIHAHGATVCNVVFAGVTPIVKACHEGQTEIVELLLTCEGLNLCGALPASIKLIVRGNLPTNAHFKCIELLLSRCSTEDLDEGLKHAVSFGAPANFLFLLVQRSGRSLIDKADPLEMSYAEVLASRGMREELEALENYQLLMTQADLWLLCMGVFRGQAETEDYQTRLIRFLLGQGQVETFASVTGGFSTEDLLRLVLCDFVGVFPFNWCDRDNNLVHVCILSGAGGQLLPLLLQGGGAVNWNARSMSGETPLIKAVLKKDLDALRILMDTEACDPSLQWDIPPFHLSALDLAIELTWTEGIILMLRHRRLPPEEQLGAKVAHLLRTDGKQGSKWRDLVVFSLVGFALKGYERRTKNTALHVAVEMKNTEAVSLLLQAGAPCNEYNADGETPLLVACRLGAHAIASALLDAPPVDPNALHQDTRSSPLMVALKKEKRSEKPSELFQKFLDDPRVDISLPDHHGRSLLDHCLELDLHLCAFAARLAGAGVAPVTYLVESVRRGSPRRCRLGRARALAQSRGCLLVSAWGDAITASVACDRDKGELDVVRLLIDLGARGKLNLKQRDSAGQTALHIALRVENLEAVKLLLPYISPLEVDSFGKTCVDLISRCENLSRVLEVMLSHPDVHANRILTTLTPNGSLLHFVCGLRRETDEVTALLDIVLSKSLAPLDLCAPVPGSGETPLHLLALGDHGKSIVLLLDRAKGKINANERNSRGLTPLQLAALHGAQDAALAFLSKVGQEAGVEVGPVAFLCAHVNGLSSISQLICDLLLGSSQPGTVGIDFNALTSLPHRFVAACGSGNLEDGHSCLDEMPVLAAIAFDKGVTPLVAALRIADVQLRRRVVAWILQQGAVDVNRADESGDFPLFLAAASGDAQVIRALLQRLDLRVNQKRYYKSNKSVTRQCKFKCDYATALGICCERGYTECANILLDDPRIDPNRGSRRGGGQLKLLPAYLCVTRFYWEILPHLLKHETTHWLSALATIFPDAERHVGRDGYPDVLRNLVQHCVKSGTVASLELLHIIVCGYFQTGGTLDQFLSVVAPLLEEPGDRLGLFCSACAAGQLVLASKLKGPDIPQRAFIDACRNGHFDVVQALLEWASPESKKLLLGDGVVLMHLVSSALNLTTGLYAVQALMKLRPDDPDAAREAFLQRVGDERLRILCLLLSVPELRLDLQCAPVDQVVGVTEPLAAEPRPVLHFLASLRFHLEKQQVLQRRLIAGLLPRSDCPLDTDLLSVEAREVVLLAAVEFAFAQPDKHCMDRCMEVLASKAGGQVNVETANGRLESLLLWTVRRRLLELTLPLLALGADPLQASVTGENALVLGAKNRQEEFVSSMVSSITKEPCGAPLVQRVVTALLESPFELDLSDLKLTALPNWASKWRWCRSLSCARNPLGKVPPELLLHWRAVRSLALSDTGLTDAEALTSLDCLQILDLSKNNLTSLPAPFSRLQQLQTLILCDNKFPRVPVCLRDLPALAELRMRNNPLSTIDSWIGHYAPLVRFALTPLPEWEIPEDIVLIAAQDTARLKLHLTGVAEGSVPCKLAKILVVGEEGVGKTALVERIKDKYRICPSGAGSHMGNISTEVVDLVDVSQNGITWRFVDFGGQLRFNGTHRFFISSKSVILVVFACNAHGCDKTDCNSARCHSGKWQVRVRFWLQSLLRMTPIGRTTKLILVGTKQELAPHFKKADALQLIQEWNSRNGGRLEITHLDLIAGSRWWDWSAGMNSLRSHIAELAQVVCEVGVNIPRIQLMLTERVVEERARRQVITWQDMVALAGSCGYAVKDVPAVVEELHCNGTLLCFQKVPRLRDTVILDPKWLSACFKVVTGFLSYGIFTENSLRNLFSRNGFSADHRQYFMSILEQFEVAFRVRLLQTSEIRVVVPSAFDRDPKEALSRFRAAAAVHGGGAVRHIEAVQRVGGRLSMRVYQISVPPLGLFSSIIARVARSEERMVQVWQCGVIVVSMEEEGEVSGIEDKSDLSVKLFVRVRSWMGGVQSLFHRLIAIVSAVLDQEFPGFLEEPGRGGITVMAACDRCLVEGRPEPHLFPYAQVKSCVLKGTPLVHNPGNCMAHVPNLAPELAMTGFCLNAVDNFRPLHIPCPNCAYGKVTYGSRACDMCKRIQELDSPKGFDFSIMQASFGAESERLWVLLEHGCRVENLPPSRQIGHILAGGSGFFGKAVVYIGSVLCPREGKREERRRAAAVKAFRVGGALEEIRHELDVMSCLMGHQNIVQLYGEHLSTQNGRSVFHLVMEFCPLGDLYGVLHTRPNSGNISQEFYWRVLLDVGEALRFIHSRAIWHRDLHSKNVLVMSMTDPQSSVCAKLTDFGLACRMGRGIALAADDLAQQNWSWLAPEQMIAGSGFVTQQCDLFSFALLAWEVAVRERPYESFKHLLRFQRGGVFDACRLVTAICGAEHLRPLAEAVKDAALRQLIVQMWDHNPDKRGTASQAVAVLQKVLRSAAPQSELPAESGAVELSASKANEEEEQRLLQQLSDIDKKLSTHDFKAAENLLKDFFNVNSEVPKAAMRKVDDALVHIMSRHIQPLSPDEQEPILTLYRKIIETVVPGLLARHHLYVLQVRLTGSLDRGCSWKLDDRVAMLARSVRACRDFKIRDGQVLEERMFEEAKLVFVDACMNAAMKLLSCVEKNRQLVKPFYSQVVEMANELARHRCLENAGGLLVDVCTRIHDLVGDRVWTEVYLESYTKIARPLIERYQQKNSEAPLDFWKLETETLMETLQQARNKARTTPSSMNEALRNVINECWQRVLKLLKPIKNSRHALVVFGSIGRSEATPFSDCEFYLLLADNVELVERQQLFEALRVLRLQLLLLGESPVTAAAPHNEMVGLCLDPGNHFPPIRLPSRVEGRADYVGTVDKLIASLQKMTENDRDALDCLLQGCCYMSGDQSLFHSFAQKLQEKFRGGIWAGLGATLLGHATSRSSRPVVETDRANVAPEDERLDDFAGVDLKLEFVRPLTYFVSGCYNFYIADSLMPDEVANAECMPLHQGTLAQLQALFERGYITRFVRDHLESMWKGLEELRVDVQFKAGSNFNRVFRKDHWNRKLGARTWTGEVVELSQALWEHKVEVLRTQLLAPLQQCAWKFLMYANGPMKALLQPTHWGLTPSRSFPFRDRLMCAAALDEVTIAAVFQITMDIDGPNLPTAVRSELRLLGTDWIIRRGEAKDRSAYGEALVEVKLDACATCMCCLRRERVFVGDTEGRMHAFVFDAQTLKLVVRQCELAHGDGIVGVEVAAQQEALYSCDARGTVVRWSCLGKLLPVRTFSSEALSCFAIRGDGREAVLGTLTTGYVKVLNLESGSVKDLLHLEGHSVCAVAAVGNSDTVLVTGGLQPSVLVCSMPESGATRDMLPDIEPQELDKVLAQRLAHGMWVCHKKEIVDVALVMRGHIFNVWVAVNYRVRATTAKVADVEEGWTPVGEWKEGEPLVERRLDEEIVACVGKLQLWREGEWHTVFVAPEAIKHLFRLHGDGGVGAVLEDNMTFLHYSSSSSLWEAFEATRRPKPMVVSHGPGQSIEEEGQDHKPRHVMMKGTPPSAKSPLAAVGGPFAIQRTLTSSSDLSLSSSQNTRNSPLLPHGPVPKTRASPPPSPLRFDFVLPPIMDVDNDNNSPIAPAPPLVEETVEIDELSRSDK